jgi:hypothetical protein
MENNNFKRKLKNINEVILDNLIKKNYLHNNQKGGNVNTTVELKQTQSHLLKTLKQINNVSVPNASIFNSSFDELNKELKNMNDKFLILNSNKYVTSDTKSIFNDFSNFDKVLNDVSGSKIDISYKNDHKISTPLKLNVESLNKIDSLLNEIGKLLDFKEREEKISVNQINKLDVHKLEPIKDFIERTEKIDLSKVNFNTLKPGEMKSLDNFQERTEKINLTKISNLQAQKDKIDFAERKETIDLQKIEKLTPINLGSNIFDFTERKEQIDIKNILDLNPETSSSSLDLDVNLYENKLIVSQEYIDKNYDIIHSKVISIMKEFDILEKILVNIQARISYLKLEFNTAKIKDITKKLIVIEENDEDEFEIIDGLDTFITIPKISFENKFIIVEDRKYPLNSDPMYTQPEFVETIYNQLGGTIYNQLGGTIYNQLGGTMNKYFHVAMKYNEILKRRTVIIKIKRTIEEYNILYIQFYYYQFFLLHNVNKFYTNSVETKGKLPIYKSLTYNTVEQFWKILYRLNEVINDPTTLFTNINSRERTVHSIFYFRYYIIIKILFEFFRTIKETWDKNKDRKYKVNLFKYDISEENQEIKDLTKCIVIFNVSYPIFVNYGNTFMRKPATI